MRGTDIRPAEEVPALLRDVAELPSGFRPGRYRRHLWKDGSLRETEVAAHSLTIGERKLILVVVHDITEQKQAERDVAYQRNMRRTVIDIVPDFIYAKDAARRVT